MQNSHKIYTEKFDKSILHYRTGQDIVSLLRYLSEVIAALSFSPPFHCVEEYLRKRDAAYSQNEMFCFFSHLELRHFCKAKSSRLNRKKAFDYSNC